MYVLIVATLNLVLGYWLGICVQEDAREEAANTPWPRPAAEIVARPSALTPGKAAEPAASSTSDAAPTNMAPVMSEPVAPAKTKDNGFVDELTGGLNTYREQLANIDSRLRSSSNAPELDQTEQCLTAFKSSSEAYLANQEQVAALLNQFDVADPQHVAVHNELQQAIEMQRQEVEAANQNVGDIDLELDLAAGFQQLLAETAKVIESNYVLGDKISSANEKLAASTKRKPEEAVDRNLIVSRDQFEATLEAWWRDHKDAGRPLTLALIDIDTFADINSRYGITLGDAVLHAVSQMLARSLRPDDRATRYSGGKFLIMLPDTTVQDSTNTVELLRQKIAATRFVDSERPVEVTVSCAVAEAEQEDTLFTLLDRVELTLQESKRYGSNCTYIYEENHPSPVTPPSFEIEARSLVL
jgi:diguanylate cyclase (GGDEF)-like protein